jgi:hypothetical protein
VTRLTRLSETWARSASVEILADDEADTHLAHLIEHAGAFPWTAVVEASVDGEQVTVRLLVDDTRLPGAVGRTTCASQSFAEGVIPSQNQTLATVQLLKGLASVFSSWHFAVQYCTACTGVRQSAGVFDPCISQS